MYSNTILKLDLIVIIIQKYCEKYLKPDKNIDKIKKSLTREPRRNSEELVAIS